MSKTVKRVSKTVKRVMTVMMVGMVAMLGAEAEAHVFVKSGKAYYCTFCINVEGTDEEGSIDHNLEAAIVHSELIEFILTTKKVELLCPNGIEVEESRKSVNLRVLKLVEPGDITRVVPDILPGSEPIGRARADVVARVSDLPLKEDLDCTNRKSPGDARDALIRQANVVVNTYACEDPTVCKPVHSFSLGTCTLPGNYNFNEYPKKLPPIGARYDCK